MASPAAPLVRDESSEKRRGLLVPALALVGASLVGAAAMMALEPSASPTGPSLSTSSAASPSSSSSSPPSPGRSGPDETQHNAPADPARGHLVTADELLKSCFGANIPSLPAYGEKGEPDLFGVFKDTMKAGTDSVLDVAGPPISVADERAAGRSGAEAVEKKTKPGGTPADIARLSKATAALLKHAPRTDELEYGFKLLQDDALNAFMLPGGYGYVLTGLLRAMPADDAGLAFVIGHELSHAALGHANSHLRVAKAAEQVGEIDPSTGEAARLAGSLALRALETAYDQDQEYEADRLGLCIALRAGFPPSSGVQGVKVLQKQGTEPRPATEEDKILYDIVSTHPPLPERIAFMEQLQALARARGAP